LKVIGSFSLPSIIAAHRRRCFLKTPLHNQQKLLQNEGISISANKPIELFKEGSDGLGNLSVSPRSKSRNGERVICEHRRSKHKNSPYSLNIAPTNVWTSVMLEAEDYGLKASITIKLRGAAAFCRTPLERFVRLPSVIFANFYFTRSNVRTPRPNPFSDQFGLITQFVKICRRSPSILKKRSCSVPIHSGLQATSTLVKNLSASTR